MKGVPVIRDRALDVKDFVFYPQDSTVREAPLLAPTLFDRDSFKLGALPHQTLFSVQLSGEPFANLRMVARSSVSSAVSAITGFPNKMLYQAAALFGATLGSLIATRELSVSESIAITTAAGLFQKGPFFPPVWRNSFKAFLTQIRVLRDHGTLVEHLKGIPPAERDALEKQIFGTLDSLTFFSSKNRIPFPARVKVVADPTEGFLSKWMLIDAAKETIDVSTFIFVEDEVGRALLAKLMQAMDRGVKVRVLIDSVGSTHPTRPGLTTLMTHGEREDVPGSAEVVIFNPIIHPFGWLSTVARAVWNLFAPKKYHLDTGEIRVNRRLHDKILLIDRDTASAAIIIGGRNLSKDYYPVVDERLDDETFHDMEILIRNVARKSGATLGSTLGQYFGMLFHHLGNKALNYFVRSTLIPKIYTDAYIALSTADEDLLDNRPVVRQALERMRENGFLETGFSADTTSIDFVNEVQSATRINAFLKPEGKNNPRNGDSILEHARKMMTRAKKTIRIVSPYLYLTPDEIKFLKKWLDADPNRQLIIISNSIHTTDNHLTQAMVDHILAPAFMADPSWPNTGGRVQVYAYGRLDGKAFGGTKNYGKLHAKYMVFDDEWALVTSANFDPRSRYLQMENGFVIHDAQVARDLTEHFEETARGSALWGSKEWEDIRRHPKCKLKTWLQRPIFWVLKKFNLIPLI